MKAVLLAYLLESYGPRLTVEECALALGFAPKTIRNRLSRGDPLPKCHRDGAAVFFAAADVAEYLEDCRTSGAELAA